MLFSLPGLLDIKASFLALGEGKIRKNKGNKKEGKRGGRKEEGREEEGGRWQEGRRQGRKEFLLGRSPSIIHFLTS